MFKNVRYIIQKLAFSSTKLRNNRNILQLKNEIAYTQKKAANFSRMIETVYAMMNELGLR